MVLGIPTGTAKSRLHRGLETLRTTIAVDPTTEFEIGEAVQIADRMLCHSGGQFVFGDGASPVEIDGEIVHRLDAE